MLPPRSNRAAYTLLEVLLALGVIAILMGISIPFIAENFRKSELEEAAERIEKAVQATRESAVGHGESRRIAIRENGLAPEAESVPAAELPAEMKLEVRRFTESKFRKPGKTESWAFNSAGICEPLTLRIHSRGGSLEIMFDPLTGQVIDE